MTDYTKETHEALLKVAVDDAVRTTETALQTKVSEIAELTKTVESLRAEVATLTGDNEGLNKSLDEAQVKLTAATEENAGLTEKIEAAAKAAEVAEVASKRGDQVKNLGLFTPEYVAERAQKWAGMDEASWTEQLEEWKQLSPASTATKEGTSDAASAMTGTTEQLTKEQQDAAAAGGSDKPNARRSVLGLV